MKIGIDARLFNKKQYTGIVRSVNEDIRIWMQKYPEHEYFLFSHRPMYFEFELPSNWHQICEPWIVDRGSLWEKFKLPNLIKREKLDVFWGTSFSLPPKVEKTKYYVTIYDLAAFRLKGITDKKNKVKLMFSAKKACKKADKIIAISQATADDVVEIFNVDRKKVVLSYCGGLPSEFATFDFDVLKVNNDFRFDEKFFLFISTIEPRKNIITIIHAFEKFVEHSKSDMKLVLAGKIGWLCDDILKAAKESKYAERIIMPGFISDEDKVYLLSHATALVYPSLYEGFGIPILEAFAYGLPVITANISSMPEVGGSAAFYITNPFDDGALAEQMEKIVQFSADERANLKLQMNEQLQHFSWEKNADEIMHVFCERT